MRDKTRGNYITTYTGKRFHLLDPREDEIDIVDVAHALSQLTRFNGHLRRFYSVAEHCVHVCRAAPMTMKGEALLHDASEAYLADMTRPAKQCMPQYVVIEKGIERVIANKFKLVYPWPREVKALDNAILRTEFQQLGTIDGAGLDFIDCDEEPLDVKVEGWPPGIAEMNFLHQAYTWLI